MFPPFLPVLPKLTAAQSPSQPRPHAPFSPLRLTRRPHLSAPSSSVFPFFHPRPSFSHAPLVSPLHGGLTRALWPARQTSTRPRPSRSRTVKWITRTPVRDPIFQRGINPGRNLRRTHNGHARKKFPASSFNWHPSGPLHRTCYLHPAQNPSAATPLCSAQRRSSTPPWPRCSTAP